MKTNNFDEVFFLVVIWINNVFYELFYFEKLKTEYNDVKILFCQTKSFRLYVTFIGYLINQYLLPLF